MANSILVPLDGSEKAFDALEYAVTEHGDAAITVLHALDYWEAGPDEGTVIRMDEGVKEAAENRAQKIFEEAEELASDLGYDGELETISREGKPSKVIVDHSSEYDTVVMGTYGRKGMGQKLLGSVAEKVVRRSPSNVVVVK